MIDLHTHSTASDGSFTPTELVCEAKNSNISAIALTDHDTTDGLMEFMAAGKKYGVQTIKGIELAASWYGASMHIVGLFIDDNNSQLVAMLKKINQARHERNLQIIQRLKHLKVDISLQELQQEALGEVIGRPHFANILVRKGKCKDFPDAFSKYLGTNKSAYMRRYLPLPKETIEVIHAAGGIAVWAHPLGLKKTPPAKFRKTANHLRKLGLDALEGYYVEYSKEQEQLANKTAKELNLKISGGSDFHGSIMPGIKLGVGKGNLNIPESVLHQLQNPEFVII